MEAIILYDGALLIFYFFASLGLTVTVELFLNSDPQNQYRVKVMWGLLPIFIAKLVAGIVAWKKNYEATPVGIQFVSRLVGDCILVVFTLLLIQIYLLYVFLSAYVVFFSVYLLSINFAFYKSQQNQNN